MIHELTNEGDLVVDPFLGSGLIAREALDLKRKFIGIDIGLDLQFDWEGRNYSATCDIIFITHKK